MPTGFPADPEALTRQTIDRYRSYLGEGLANILQFGGYGVEWTGEDCLIYDAAGKPYIDCVGVFGVMALGHRRPEVVEAAIEQMRRLPLSTRNFFSSVWAELAEDLARVTPGHLCRPFFCHSGAEAVEGAIKLARLATGRPGLVSTEGSYHGKTLGALSVSGREKYKQPFEPLLPGCRQAPFGDAAALESVVDSQTAAVIVEPIQGEGGVIVPPDGYLSAVQSICRRAGALFVVDEVQTGLGRTGTLFACEPEGVTPDIMTLAKALGGGVAPLAAFVTTPDLWDRMFDENPWLHSTTVANLVAMAAGRAALRILIEEDLPSRAARAGDRFLAGLRDLQERYPRWIVESRGRGLMIGVETSHSDLALMVTQFLTMRGVVVAYTLNNPKVIRIEPPLTIPDDLIDRVLTSFHESVADAIETLESLEPGTPG